MATARPAAALAAGLALLAMAPLARGDDAAATSAATSGTATGAIPYWQAPPLPQAVIQGNAIPAGWQPAPVPYQGVGPDGRPVTMYFAPTYVFTYQAGPPVLAAPTPNRRPPAAAPSAASSGYGWNYQAQGASAVPLALPPATVARYQAPYQAPYQFPPDARALSGTPIVPPATPLPGPPAGMAPAMQPPMAPGMAPPQQLSSPPTQWVPSAVPPPPGVAP